MKRLRVYFTPLGVKPADVAGAPVVVLDVLRATTTIVTALANGARSVVPAANSEEALRLADNLERDGVLLVGERGTKPIPGFDLGNSPLEMKRQAVEGKTLVMSTTNGTPAFLAVESASPVLVGAIVNFSAAVERARELFEESDELVILCAGRERMFALEDAYTAGRLAQAVLAGRGRNPAELNDAAIAARELVRRYGDKWKRAILASTAAKDLKPEYRDDIAATTEVDTYDFVPVYSDRLIRLP